MAEHDIFFQLKDLWIKFGPASKSYPIVKGINLNIKRGKVLGLVGESGCGKSITMLSSMDLLLKNNCEVTGNVLLDGQELNGLPDKESQKIRGERISMAFQEPMTSPSPVFIVGQQLGEALEQHLSMTGQANKAKYLELLNPVSIPGPASVYDYYPFKLPGDMRQRVMTVMTLACDPELVIADEPTTTLDVTTQVQIIDLSEELQKKLNTAIIFISHDLGVTSEISDNIAILYAGYVMEECDTKALFRDPLHLCTFGLMSSRMGRNLKSKDKPYSIPGMVPSTENMPAGCPSAPRCLKVGGQCACEIPPLVEVEPGRKARCWEVTNHVEAID